MQYRRTETLQEALQNYLREEGLETPLLEHRAVSSWGDVAGERINKYTNNVYLFNQKLYVELTSAAARNLVVVKRQELLRKLNQIVGSAIVTDIVVK